MREIKFRIWNKSHKKMNYFDSPSLKIDHDSGIHFKVKEEHIYLGGYADDIMQYTGLRDKNGADIYEGDIFKTRNGVVAVVEWDENNGRFLGFTLERERKIVYVGQEPAVEVICNIYDALGVYLVETDTTGTSMKNNRY